MGRGATVSAGFAWEKKRDEGRIPAAPADTLMKRRRENDRFNLSARRKPTVVVGVLTTGFEAGIRRDLLRSEVAAGFINVEDN